MGSTMQAKIRELLARGKDDSGSYAATIHVAPTLKVYVGGESFVIANGEVDCGALVWADGAIDIDAIDVAHIHPDNGA